MSTEINGGKGRDRSNRCVLWVLAICYLLAILAFPIAPDLLEVVLRKEGPIEHLTHVTLLVGVLMSAYLVVGFCRAWRFVLFGLFQAVFLLEEIDWGQLIFEFPTPRWVLALSPGGSGRMNFHSQWGGPVFVVIVVSMFLLVPAWRHFRGKPHAVRSPADLRLITNSQALATLAIGIGTVVATGAGHVLSSGLRAEPIVQELSDFLFSVVVSWVPLVHLLAWRAARGSAQLPHRA